MSNLTPEQAIDLLGTKRILVKGPSIAEVLDLCDLIRTLADRNAELELAYREASCPVAGVLMAESAHENEERLLEENKKLEARISELEALRCLHPNHTVKNCEKQWEADRQKAALTEMDLVSEFYFGCDSISHVGEALLAARARISQLENAFVQADERVDKAIEWIAKSQWDSYGAAKILGQIDIPYGHDLTDSYRQILIYKARISELEKENADMNEMIAEAGLMEPGTLVGEEARQFIEQAENPKPVELTEQQKRMWAEMQATTKRSEDLEKLRSEVNLSGGIKCPDCDDSGVCIESNRDGDEQRQAQCQFCYEVTDSIFNRRGRNGS